jgi:hypothetical protein
MGHLYTARKKEILLDAESIKMRVGAVQGGVGSKKEPVVSVHAQECIHGRVVKAPDSSSGPLSGPDPVTTRAHGSGPRRLALRWALSGPRPVGLALTLPFFRAPSFLLFLLGG